MKLFGYEFSPMTPLELSRAITEKNADGPQAIFTANVDHIVKLRSNPSFRDAYEWAWVRTIDGFPVLLYSKMKLGRKQVRVTGSDLLPLLIDNLKVANSRVFAVCPTQTSGEHLKGRLIKRGFEPTDVIISSPQIGFEDDEQSRKLATDISHFKPSHLLFCLGSPKSEIWVHRNRSSFGNCYILCLGSAPSFLAGELKRAPKWMSKFGFEWFWRFLMEPKRLFKRYFLNSWKFGLAIVNDMAGLNQNVRGE